MSAPKINVPTFQNITDGIRDNVAKIGKDIEKDVGKRLSSAMYQIGSGNLNNLGGLLPGGGETALERKQREDADKAADEKVLLQTQEIQMKEDEKLRKIAMRLEQGANTRARQPGAQQLLIGSGSGTGNLLTGVRNA